MQFQLYDIKKIIRGSLIALFLLCLNVVPGMASTVTVYYANSACWSNSVHCPGEEYLIDCSGRDSNGNALCLFNDSEGCSPGYQYFCPYDWTYEKADSATLSSSTATVSTDYLTPLTIPQGSFNITSTAYGVSPTTPVEHDLFISQWDWNSRQWSADTLLERRTTPGAFPWDWTPSQPGNYCLRSRVKANYMWEWDVYSPYYFFFVQPSTPLSMTTSLPSFLTVNDYFGSSTSLQASGGVLPYTWLNDWSSVSRTDILKHSLGHIYYYYNFSLGQISL